MGATLAIVSLIGQAAGTVFSAVGSLGEAQAQKAQANYLAAVARNNMILANRAAEDATERGKTAENLQRMRNKQFIGRQRTAFASQGVLVDSGSALDAVSDSAMLGELDALTIRDNAAREAAGYRAQGSNFSAESQLQKMRAQQSSGWGAFAGTLLSGATNVAAKWYEYGKEGVFGPSTLNTPSSRATGTFGIPRPGYI